MIVIDQLSSYPTAKAEIPALARVRHVFVEACPGIRAENSHHLDRE